MVYCCALAPNKFSGTPTARLVGGVAHVVLGKALDDGGGGPPPAVVVMGTDIVDVVKVVLGAGVAPPSAGVEVMVWNGLPIAGSCAVFVGVGRCNSQVPSCTVPWICPSPCRIRALTPRSLILADSEVQRMGFACDQLCLSSAQPLGGINRPAAR